MITQCARCGKEIEKSCGYEHRGNVYCEDCYMDILSPCKACDPWAVHSAKKFLKGKDKLSELTPQQLKIINYIKEKIEVTAEEIMEGLHLTEKELKREFAILRHMEILGATKKEGKIYYTMFQ
jgi:late competence protein required for DNA uptake (superfamily II DNA/RNA helicase)